MDFLFYFFLIKYVIMFVSCLMIIVMSSSITCPGLVDLCLILSPRLSHLHSKNNTRVYVKLICVQLVIYSTMMAAKVMSWFLVCDCLVISVKWMMGSILFWIRAEKESHFLAYFVLVYLWHLLPTGKEVWKWAFLCLCAYLTWANSLSIL